jgi:activating signal cointegrator complex subunit 3
LTPHHSTAPDPSQLYPNVYDSLSRAKLTAAYIAGAKVGIPENAVRKSDRMMEEFHIPHSSAPPPPVGEEKVRIAEIDDDLIQIAFQGVKTLNRIQSIVFDVAFYTSENLLISAPTGAGKTNIAMLTVLREIKNNMEGAVIKRGNFKIIYVAPMKALAAEMVRNFSGRLAPLGITVRELTGDMQLTKNEIKNTQMIVTTPEKWDVVTRKSTGDIELAQIVRLLIIDEIHLLHEDRGAVIESLVARTLRQVESSQTLIRIVGLSATLPNYVDVARFLRVNLHQGLFFFDSRFRPVPLAQTFVGVKATNRNQQMRDMEEVCYEKVFSNVRRGYQVMVFVHARNATVRTATALRDLASSNGDLAHFQHEQTPRYGAVEKQVMRSRNKQLRDLFGDGFSIHHAGMLRSDRNLVERMFAEGFVKVLVCTATLAWGVNLPAHAVIIKGTQVYNAQKGAFIDLGILDVLQIFGRAGRPQYDTYGEGTIITAHDKLSHYVSLMTRQHPIESRLKERLRDNLNAEIALGTVTSVEEAVQWLGYTYLYVRMRLNPLVYGIPNSYRETDPTLELYMRGLIEASARSLTQARMIRFIEHTGTLHSTDLGRTASHYYINAASIETFNELLKPYMNEAEMMAMVAKSEEFEQVKVREDEQSELEEHRDETCVLPVRGGVENSYGKVNILLQVYISREAVDSFSLTSDLAYVAKNAGRIIRGLFEIVLRRGWPVMSSRLLTLCRCVDRQLWSFQHPLRQFEKQLSHEVLNKIESRKMELHRLKDMTADEIGHMIHHPRMGTVVKRVLASFPSLLLAATIQPITRTVLRVRLLITPDFEWDDRIHGSAGEPWWLWIEDSENNAMYHSEYFLLQKKQVVLGEAQELVFAIPITEPLCPQYIVKVTSDRWLGAGATVAISFKHLILPEIHPPHTKLLDLHPLPVTALKNTSYESIYSFSYFNPIQTQVFHTLYHSDSNVLLGAPTGSGKTVAAELAIFRVFNCYPGGKAVYIAPMKALVRERVDDWNERMERRLGKRVVELTGDSSPDIRAIERADVIVTTPEKWDGISRSWQNRAYVQAVRLLVIDEIHLLGDERGPVLEVIVSRTNFIASHTEHKVRVVGLSTALANAGDLADWLEIKQDGLFNFHPAVRPVQLEVHIDGFPGKHYCPRMATMNKPTYTAIRTYSPVKPVLVFVSSRRQTRLTAFDLVAYVAREDNSKQWLHMPENELETLLQSVQDQNLRFTLAFGVGLHHAGLLERDRKTVEKLFVNQKIQVLIATSTLAWGVNFPAHLVVVKGTEYFDGKTQRYVDYPITDVLQMMGRAGRPQYDDRGVAVILVHDIKKHFYKKFLYEPFPVESNLLQVLADHLNAEIVSGTVTTKQDALDYLTWTYFFRRLLMNPSYYQLKETDTASVNSFLTNIVSTSLSVLQSSHCIAVEEDDRTLQPLTLGCIASYYYLHHSTVRLFKERLHTTSSYEELLLLLSDCSEYAELPVRHNEDVMNASLAPKLPIPVSPDAMDSPHTKTHLLLQAHFSRAPLPIADYGTDTKSVLDQALRILQAMIDVAASEGWLAATLRIMSLVQMSIQGRWSSDSSLLTLPHVEERHVDQLNEALSQSRVLVGKGLKEVLTLAELQLAAEVDEGFVTKALGRSLSRQDLKKLTDVISKLPALSVTWRLRSPEKNSGRDSSGVQGVGGEGEGGVVRGQRWVDVGMAEECVVVVQITRNSHRKSHDTRAYAPKYPKQKDEGWWVLIGEVDSGELLALKRLGYIRTKTVTTLAFLAPEEPCRKIYTLYLISDCYLGLDQQHDLCLNFVTPGNE